MEELGGSVVEYLTHDQASPEALHCVLKQDTLSSS